MTGAAPAIALTAGLTLVGLAACAADSEERRLMGPEGPIGMAGDEIPQPLASEPPDAARGREVFLDRERGHCLRCHQVASLEAPFQGNLGPDLSRVGSRLTPGQIRLRLVDTSQLNPETVMPPYHRVRDLYQVAEPYQGTPILNAREIEDLVAYLVTLGDENEPR